MNNLFKIFCCLLLNIFFQNKCLAQLKTCLDWCLFHPNECNELAHFQTVVPATQCINDPLVLVFEDQFDGNSINLDNWRVYDESNPNGLHDYGGCPRDGDFEFSKQWYQKENVVVEDNKLRIIAKRETKTDKHFQIWGTNEYIDYYETFDFTSGEVDTKWEFGYGVYEIRCKMPGGDGPGFFPAFWGYADASGDHYEIDVFEFMSSGNRRREPPIWGDYIYPLKDWLATNHSQWGGVTNMCKSNINGGQTNYSQGFHIFKVQFLPWVLRWYVDGVMVKEVYKNYQMGTGGAYYPINCTQSYPGYYLRDKTFPFGPMNIKIDLAIEPRGFAPDATTTLPASLDIDYVKIYQYIPCQGVININSQSELDALLSSQENYYNVIFGTIINIDNCLLKEKRALRLIASQEINFGSNFITETGSYLESSLGECQSTAYKQNIDNTYNQSEFDVFSEKNGDMAQDRLEEKIQLTKKVSINPNPLYLKNNLLNLNLLSNHDNEVSIVSASGLVIMNHYKVNEANYQIKSELFKSSGVYYIFIRDISGSKTYHFKLIVL